MTLASSICPEFQIMCASQRWVTWASSSFGCCHFHAPPGNRRYCLICLPRIYIHMQTRACTRTGSFPEPRRDKSDTREAFVSSTCRMAVTAEQTVPRLCFDTDTRAPLYSPKVCCQFFTLFVKALSSPFWALPQLPNGSCTVSCLCLAFSAKKGLLFVFLLHKLHFKSHESKMYRGLHSQAVQI